MIQIGPVEIDHEKLAEICRRYRVPELSVLGSAAQGKMRPDSDVDFLLEFLPQAGIGLLGYAGLLLDLPTLVGCKLDLGSKTGVKPLMPNSVLREAQLLYAA